MKAKNLAEWRQKVLSRDNNTCQICRTTLLSEDLEAHHIKDRWDYPDLALETDNGKALCYSCHRVGRLKDKTGSHTIRVHKGGSAYFSDDLREDGYVGDLTVIPDACAAVLEKPGASPKDIAKSLEILKAHYEHLAEMERERQEDKISKPE